MKKIKVDKQGRLIPDQSTDLTQSESEVGAMVEATKDTIFFRNLMQDLHQTQWKAMPLYNDSKSAIILTTKYSGNHKRVRYCLEIYILVLGKSKRSFDKGRHVRPKYKSLG